MTTPHDRVPPDELTAHALGLLDADGARAVDIHLAGCDACHREWEELRATVAALDELPPEAFLEGPPDGDLVLQRALRSVRAETAAHRRRRRSGGAAAAAVVAAAVLGGGVLLGRATAASEAPTAAPTAVTQAGAAQAGAVTAVGTDQDGATLHATLVRAASWVRVQLTVTGVPAGERCQVIVVGRDGRTEVAGSWVVSPDGERSGTTLDGSAAIALPDVAAVVVEGTDGHEYVRATT